MLPARLTFLALALPLVLAACGGAEKTCACSREPVQTSLVRLAQSGAVAYAGDEVVVERDGRFRATRATAQRTRRARGRLSTAQLHALTGELRAARIAGLDGPDPDRTIPAQDALRVRVAHDGHAFQSEDDDVPARLAPVVSRLRRLLPR